MTSPESPSGATPPTPADAWADFCGRLAAVGASLDGDGYPTDERGRVDGVRHLANQVAGWLYWTLSGLDEAHPAFWRQNDLVVRWGGPNVDQVTKRARLDPGGRYVIRGEMGTCEDFVLTLKNGDMHRGLYGILTERLASDLGIGPGDHFEIHLGGTEAPTDGPWLPLPDGVAMVNLREYYWDWQPASPAVAVIERLDTAGVAAQPPTAGAVAAALDEAATIVEHSLPYWRDWVAARRSEIGVNRLGPPQGSAGGSSRIAYGFGFFDLAPDECFVIDTEVPPDGFFDVQLYSLGWFESLDFANRCTSRNHHQTHRDADGRARFVIAHTDPRVPNWLDTEGRREGMVTYRWIATEHHPVAMGSVVARDRLADVLPHGTPEVDPAARAAEVAARQAHAAWRYRA